MKLSFYLADYDGWRVLVTPRPMRQNSEGLVELTDVQLNAPPYDKVRPKTPNVSAAITQARPDGNVNVTAVCTSEADRT